MPIYSNDFNHLLEINHLPPFSIKTGDFNTIIFPCIVIDHHIIPKKSYISPYGDFFSKHNIHENYKKDKISIKNSISIPSNRNFSLKDLWEVEDTTIKYIVNRIKEQDPAGIVIKQTPAQETTRTEHMTEEEIRRIQRLKNGGKAPTT